MSERLETQRESVADSLLARSAELMQRMDAMSRALARLRARSMVECERAQRLREWCSGPKHMPVAFGDE